MRALARTSLGATLEWSNRLVNHVRLAQERVNRTFLDHMARKMPPNHAQFLVNEWVARETVESQNSILSDNDKNHHIFGSLVAEVGQKRVYLSSVEKLVSCDIWQKQRILRMERARLIADTKIAAADISKAGPCFPGSISLVEDENSGNVAIIDGQHRLAAMVMMSNENRWNRSENNITVELFKTKTDGEVEALFKDINSAEPVLLVDMPGMATPEELELLDAATQALHSMYPKMFSLSSRPKRPHIHIDGLRQDLHSSGFLRRYRIKSAEQLVRRLLRINREMKKQYSETVKYPGDKVMPGLEKALKNAFFLGLSKEWLTSA